MSSSVYHGECDSVQTREDDSSPAMVWSSGGKSAANRSKGSAASVTGVPSSGAAAAGDVEDDAVLAQQDILVGHQFGERPLLADDELDHEEFRSIPAKTGILVALPLHFRKRADPTQGSGKDRHQILKSSAESSVPITEEDVFAMAPFKLPPKVWILRSFHNFDYNLLFF